MEVVLGVPCRVTPDWNGDEISLSFGIGITPVAVKDRFRLHFANV